MTPLYKALKKNGTSFYAFPGAAEDISAAYQNSNYKMYFSKYVLLNFPKQDTPSTNNPAYFDFQNTSTFPNPVTKRNLGFQMPSAYTPPIDFKDQLVESLRNYVANHEVTMKESRLNSTEYYYDNTIISTPTEKIFWKWCKKLGLLSLEPANDGDEFFGNLVEFNANSTSNEFFPEILWRERESVDYSVLQFLKSPANVLQIQLQSDEYAYFQIGDVIEISGPTTVTGILVPPNFTPVRAIITAITPRNLTTGMIITTNLAYTGTTPVLAVAGDNTFVTLVYHRLVQYIGEVNGINNVQQSNRAYTEVYAHVPDSTGKTPDILFRIKDDKNYKPLMTYPILPSQNQPEIVGAELFTNPLVSNPNNYPGSYYGHFDTADFTYTTSDGDSIRRSGDYYGIRGTRDIPISDSRSIDGMTLDFDPSHYVKMNISGQPINNFDQFNAMMVNGEAPTDFEFNAILWYYTIEDTLGNKTNNVYGISFVDNPDNNPIPTETGKRIGAFRKLAASDVQDGTSYAFSLNLNFNIINENPQDTFNPEAINSLFSFNLFNDAMRRIGELNDAFLRILTSQNRLQSDIGNMKQLLYTQNDFQTINSRINNLDSLLKLYSTNQIDSTDSIFVSRDDSQRPPRINLTNIDVNYGVIYNFNTSNLYGVNGVIPGYVSVPMNKNFLINVRNDDVNDFSLPDNQKLTIILDKDLSYRQTVDIVVDGTANSTQNKQLEIFINFKFGDSQNPVESQLVETINLPVYYNNASGYLNTAATRERFAFDVDTYDNIRLNIGGTLELKLLATSSLVYNSISKGDEIILDDFIIGTSSRLNFSGQYKVNSVGSTNSLVSLDVNNNPSLIGFGNQSGITLPYTFNDPNKYLISSVPFFKLNKGIKYRITRISPSNDSELVDRYFVEKYDLAN
jgi:hypothetical protein